MQITRQADYAARAVLYLSRLAPGAQAATAVIAREAHVPAAFLSKIVAQLGAAGLLRATRGARGGVTLARPAAEISLLQVVEAIDGSPALNACAADPRGCELAGACGMEAVWSQARQDLVARLGRVTFADMLAPGAAAQADTLAVA